MLPGCLAPPLSAFGGGSNRGVGFLAHDAALGVALDEPGKVGGKRLAETAPRRNRLARLVDFVA